MRRRYRGSLVQIGNRPRDLEDTVVSSRGQRQLIRGTVQKRAGTRCDTAVNVNPSAGGVRVAADAFEAGVALMLPSSGARDSLANPGG